jgi:transcriptional regulator with GAF, ATPase, and Fis domain
MGALDMSRTKYTVLIILIVLIAAYRLLLTFNILPYVIGGEDITVILLLLVALLLFFLSGTIHRVAKTVTGIRENVSMNIRTEHLDALALAENLKDTTGYKFMIGIQNYLNNVTSSDELLNKFIVVVVKLTDSARASIMLHDSRRDELFIYRTVGWENREIHLAKKMKSKPGEGIAGRVFLDGEPLVVNKSAEHEEYDAKEKYKSKSFISFPILSGKDTVGVLNLTEKRNGRYLNNEIEVIQFISGIVALKLHNITMVNGAIVQ